MESFEKEAVDVFSSLFQNMGLKDLAVRLLATLYFEPKEISLENLANKTGYSLASISQTMSVLENIGTIQKIRKPGSKKLYYYMEKNLIKLNIQKLRAAQELFVRSIKLKIPPLINEYKNKLKTKEEKQKMKVLEDYYDQVLEFEKIIIKWRKDLEHLALK